MDVTTLIPHATKEIIFLKYIRQDTKVTWLMRKVSVLFPSKLI